MKNKDILSRIVAIFSNEEKAEETKAQLTPEEIISKVDYIKNNTDKAKEETLISVYDTLFAEVGEVAPEETEETLEEAPMEDVVENKEEIVEAAHEQAEQIVAEENETLKIVNELKNEISTLKNEIEAFKNAPSKNQETVVVDTIQTTSTGSKYDEALNKYKNIF